MVCSRLSCAVWVIWKRHTQDRGGGLRLLTSPPPSKQVGGLAGRAFNEALALNSTLTELPLAGNEVEFSVVKEIEQKLEENKCRRGASSPYAGLPCVGCSGEWGLATVKSGSAFTVHIKSPRCCIWCSIMVNSSNFL